MTKFKLHSSRISPAIPSLSLLLALSLIVAPSASSIAKNVPRQHTQVQTRPVVAKLDLGGKLICNLSRDVVIETAIGTVHCAPKVTVYVFINDHGLTVFNFDSNGKDDVKLVVGKNHILIHPAEQVAVSRTAQAKFDEINAGLGIIHKAPQKVDIGSEYSCYTTEFSLASGVKKIPVLTRMISSEKPGEKQIIERILKNAAILQSSAEKLLKRRPAPTGMVASNTVQSPQGQMLKGGIERFARGNGQTQPQLIDMTVAQCFNRGFANVPGMSWVELVDGDWKLQGSKPRSTNAPYETAGLMTCATDTILKTELGLVDCKKGATVFVVNRGDCISVCTLDAPHLDDVSVRLSNKPPMRLSPGRQIVLTKDLDGAFEKVNPTHLIGYRDEKVVGTVEGTKVVRADFSLAAAMMSVEPLRRMASSKDSQQARLAQSIVKNSVILWGLTAGQGIFHASKQ